MKRSDSELIKDFRAAANKVWENSPLINQISISVEHTDVIEFIGVLYNRRIRPMAINGHLVQTAREITLQVSDNLFEMSEKEYYKTMKHEALHLGYRGHGKAFCEDAKKKGVIVSICNMRSKTFSLQVKQGHRYKTIKQFDTYDEAKEFFLKKYHPSHPGSKGRIEF